MKDRSETAKIRRVINHWVGAICRGDIDGILANHTRGVLMFDVPEPLQSKGIVAYKKTWDLFYQYGTPGRNLFSIKELRITAGGKAAFATGLLCIGGATKPECRLTLGLVKTRSKWLIAHEHHSAPVKLESK